MCEPLRFKDAKVLSVTISRGADDWYVSISCELTSLTHLKPAKNQGRVGVDLGILKMAVLSDGHVFEAPMPLKHALARLKILQEIMSRAKRGSRNRQKLRVRIARLHRRIANIRSHAIHKLTAFLASNYSEVVIEDLNVKGMMANHHLARAIGDVGFYEFQALPLLRWEERGFDAQRPFVGMPALRGDDRRPRPERRAEPLSLLKRLGLGSVGFGRRGRVVREYLGQSPAGYCPP